MPAAQTLLAALLDTIFPRRCAGCGIFDCWVCPLCLQTATTPNITLWSDNHESVPELLTSRFVSLGLYHQPLLEHLMELYKFHGAKELADSFAALLMPGVETLIRNHLERSTHTRIFLVPIPLHKRRIRERGFDQNALLARALVRQTQQTNVLLAENVLRRTRYTTHQTAVSTEMRSDNIANVFMVHPASAELIHENHIILIDDIATTGATLNEAARVLLPYTPASIQFATALRS